MSVKRGFIGLFAVSATAFALAAGSASAAIDPANPYVPATTAVGDLVKTNFGIFRQTDSVTIPADLRAFVTQDVQNGNPAFGQNVDLARPAYRSATNRQDPFWVVPGAEDHLCLWVPDGKGAKYGWGVSCLPAVDAISDGLFVIISKGKELFPVKSLAVLLPDSVTRIQLTTRKKLRSGKKKVRKLNVPVYDNVASSAAKNIVAMKVLGVIYPLEPEKKKKRRR